MQSGLKANQESWAIPIIECCEFLLTLNGYRTDSVPLPLSTPSRENRA